MATTTIITITTTIMTMPEAGNGQGMTLELALWLSPAFPVGSFAFSHGLEWVVDKGEIHDRTTTEAWLGDLLAYGAARNDAMLLAAAWRAADSGDSAKLAEINDLALALAGSRERHLETSAQGTAFLETIKASWSIPGLDPLATGLGTHVAYPVAVGFVAGVKRCPLNATVAAYLGAQIANLVSTVVRLGTIGHTDGQRVIAALVPRIVEIAALASNWTLDDLGQCAVRSDIAAMAHETQYTRLFRT